MKERPILFSAPMVRAILEGRKTQTRRAVKLPYNKGSLTRDVWTAFNPESADDRDLMCLTGGPYGVVGDRLWVRETHGWNDPEFERPDIEDAMDRPRSPEGRWCWYRATDGEIDGPWRPSIFMPRWASRITLEVTGVKVERLNEITTEDGRAEGQGIVWGGGCFHRSFAGLWDAVYGSGAWDANPWVWAISFKRVTP